MTHSEALEYLENRFVTVTNGLFYISGLLYKENDLYSVFVTETTDKRYANVDFTIENIESITVTENAFLLSVSESKRYTIGLKG